MSINRRLRNWSTSMWHKVFQKQCYWHFGPSNFLEGEGLCCFFKKGGTVLHIVRYLAACLDLTLRCQQHPTRSYEKKKCLQTLPSVPHGTKLSLLFKAYWYNGIFYSYFLKIETTLCIELERPAIYILFREKKKYRTVT